METAANPDSQAFYGMNNRKPGGWSTVVAGFHNGDGFPHAHASAWKPTPTCFDP
jgi:hypothetical protein